MKKQRFFKYVGEPTLTRGDYGIGVRGGHTNEYGMICVFDPDYGDRQWIDADAGVECGDWKEISEAEWANLTR